MRFQLLSAVAFLQTIDAFNSLTPQERFSYSLLMTPQTRGEFLQKVSIATLSSSFITQEPLPANAIDPESTIQPITQDPLPANAIAPESTIQPITQDPLPANAIAPESTIQPITQEPLLANAIDPESTIQPITQEPLPAKAIEPEFPIKPCKIRRDGKPINCVSTSSVKQVDCYVAPWTFEVSASEAQKTLKGVFAADPIIYEEIYEGKNYLRVNAIRGPVSDQLEFSFNEEDKYVKIRSAEISDNPFVSDFGANRRRLSEIRKIAKLFNVMGGGGYDSIEQRGTGPLGQLKSFYGLQSGAGFEDVFKD